MAGRRIVESRAKRYDINPFFASRDATTAARDAWESLEADYLIGPRRRNHRAW
jgi:hypothetical protein